MIEFLVDNHKELLLSLTMLSVMALVMWLLLIRTKKTPFIQDLEQMDTSALDEYDKALRSLPPRVLEERAEDYKRYCNKHLTPILQEIHLLRVVQPVKYKNGEQVITYSKQAKQRLAQLERKENTIRNAAEIRFWKGYEHLKPGNNER